MSIMEAIMLIRRESSFGIKHKEHRHHHLEGNLFCREYLVVPFRKVCLMNIMLDRTPADGEQACHAQNLPLIEGESC
jgi:hypothetical protein